MSEEHWNAKQIREEAAKAIRKNEGLANPGHKVASESLISGMILQVCECGASWQASQSDPYRWVALANSRKIHLENAEREAQMNDDSAARAAFSKRLTSDLYGLPTASQTAVATLVKSMRLDAAAVTRLERAVNILTAKLEKSREREDELAGEIERMIESRQESDPSLEAEVEAHRRTITDLGDKLDAANNERRALRAELHDHYEGFGIAHWNAVAKAARQEISELLSACEAHQARAVQWERAVESARKLSDVLRIRLAEAVQSGQNQDKRLSELRARLAERDRDYLEMKRLANERLQQVEGLKGDVRQAEQVADRRWALIEQLEADGKRIHGVKWGDSMATMIRKGEKADTALVAALDELEQDPFVLVKLRKELRKKDRRLSRGKIWRRTAQARIEQLESAVRSLNEHLAAEKMRALDNDPPF